MSTRAARRPIVTALVALALVGTTAACAPETTTHLLTGAAGMSSTTQESVQESAPQAPSGAAASGTATAAQDCGDGQPAVASLDPGGSPEVTSGSTMADIREQGFLRVGVSADTLLMGSRDPFTSDIEGFDIDVARQVAEAIFGDPDAIQYRVITSGDREAVLQDHQVDIVARAFTINCERWENIAFSAEYYHAGQKLLVPSTSDVASIDDLSGQRVCAPEGTTTLERLGEWEGVEAVPAATHTTCLVLFQQGAVDAITGDDTVLAGFAAQDPYAKVVGDPVSDEPYGVGVPADQPDMVRFVNGVLEDMVAGGQWEESYERWLGDALGPAPTAPEPVYGRTP
ncbi:amino acid ABC transporter substrate-binding protein, PAAT family (TC 3.A.1.3.-) [Promicromonospora umidemergens]|uniref:Glutamate ABC transporter substrate-binding protein n=1 Tax=Promicromonospora umidemergens TaxID=629679 RepID=A0ABP8WQ53_9MICO|nr:glutamate ABC transporter substrate-binding protein [Promicromonospora umidemergens]MCP2283288.1 amino acid ABC transporter substrate-binding protein, PAAT family (TC 3.A.1.3.-) [Promicromonospora umidemergens]